MTGVSKAEAARPLRIVVVGHVDHGKSTLVGRLLHDTGALPDGKVREVEANCKSRGMQFEWAFVTDALQIERDQGITVDVSHIPFKSAKRPYVLIDAPGHREFVKNMVTGAAAADAAVLVIDVAEGVREQSRRHGLLLHLLGIEQVAIVLNKMDLIGDDPARFEAVRAEYEQYLASIGVRPAAMIPVAAREGANIVSRAGSTPWYQGPTLLAALDAFAPKARAVDRPLRLPVQDIYKFDSRRIVAGRIESGRIKTGDTIVFSPSNKTTRVRSIEQWSAVSGFAPPASAEAGQSVGITTEDEIVVERGDVISHASDMPFETDVFRARLFWLGREPLEAGKRMTLRMGTQAAPACVQEIGRIVGSGDLTERAGARVETFDVAEIVLRVSRVVALDGYSANAATGRFVLSDGADVLGGGVVELGGYPDQRAATMRKGENLVRVEHRVSVEQRVRRNGHKGGVVWLTGLSGAGKSTVAMGLEQALFARGFQVYVLDGDNVRSGLNANLGFGPDDRAENIRRVGEAAALFAEAGFVAVTAFISPYRSDRARARAAASRVEGLAGFHEVFVKAALETCEKRDPKGLYRKARAGQIAEFTGVSAPYEAPEMPELVLDTDRLTADRSVELLADYVARNFQVRV
jgi:bifunctional enzyme CysN/CysC